MTVYLGIDPGKTGAAWLYDMAAGTCRFVDLPYLGREPDFCALHAWLLNANHECRVTLASVEKQNPRPGSVATNTFNMGQGYGAIRMALASLEIPYETVAPNKWKADVGLLRADKNRSRALASQLLPAYAEHFARVKDDGRAEAALLALRAAGAFTSKGKAA